MLARLETMVLMAGVDLPLRAIREQVSSAVDLIVHQSRMKDGSRRIEYITEVQGMEGDVIVMQDVFLFEQTGVVDGKIQGRAAAHRHPAQVRREVRGHGHPPAARPVRLRVLTEAGRGDMMAVILGLLVGIRHHAGRPRPGDARAAAPGISARLERYAAGRNEATAASTGTAAAVRPRRNASAQSVALARLNRVVEQRDFGANLARDIARADLKLKPGEFIAIWGVTILTVPFLFFVLGFVLTPLQTPIALLIGAVVGFFLPRMWLGRRRDARLNAFNKQLPDTITLIANALRAGSSFLQAIEMVVREAQPPITVEFGRVVREVNLGLAFDVALDNMVRRVRSDDLELMATAITIQHQVGGNLAEILDSIAFTIRERVRIKGEIRTLTAQQRMSGYVVAGMPIGLVGILFVIAPSFMQPMFENPPGILGLPAGLIILMIGGFFMFIGFMLIRRIVAIEV